MKTKIIGIIILALLLCGMSARVYERRKPMQVVTTDTYIVQTGDTLWSIAKKHCPKKMDIRDYVDDIVTRNRLDGVQIMPGQEIEIFMAREEGEDEDTD